MNATGWLALLVVIVLLGAGALLWVRAEGDAPALHAPEELVVGAEGARVTLHATDLGSGLRSLRAVLVHPGGEAVLLEETYPGNLLSGGVRYEHTAEIALEPRRLEDVRGAAFLRVSLRDWSWRGGLDGNETRRDVALTIDLEPPRIDVHSGLTYVKQGGSGAVAYRVSEETARDGVRVGDREYRGHPLPGGGERDRVALFAVPAEGPADPDVRVFAVDPAGNESTVSWAVVVQARPRPESRVRLSRSFLENVVPRLAPPGNEDDLAAAFHDVNTRVRAESEERIRELVAESAPRPLFRGRLDQLANSKVTSRFGERRRYVVDGAVLSQAVHYGYDLASYAAAPVTAAAAGRVQFAGDLGIYGNCVLVDHGLGLTTLYGHLSRLDVETGDAVERGQRLGLSGDTGLAGGDHLHFAVLVGETYVDPLEWWDAEWVRTHVDANLRPQVP